MKKIIKNFDSTALIISFLNTQDVNLLNKINDLDYKLIIINGIYDLNFKFKENIIININYKNIINFYNEYKNDNFNYKKLFMCNKYSTIEFINQTKISVVDKFLSEDLSEICFKQGFHEDYGGNEGYVITNGGNKFYRYSCELEPMVGQEVNKYGLGANFLIK